MRNARRQTPTARDQGAIAETMQAAIALHQRGVLTEAEKLYASVLESVPRHFDALHLLGVLMQQRGENAEGLRLIDAALEINSRSADALANRGKALLMAGRTTEALESIDQALAINSGHIAALIIRATALIALARFADAAHAAEAALRLDAANADAWVKHGNALSSLGEHATALESYERALALKPRKIEALNNRGFCLGELGRTEAALAAYDALLAVEPNHVEGLINRGHMLVELGREAEALSSYQRTLTVAPNDPDALFNLGINQLRLGDLRGWAGYEYRWTARAFAHVQRDERYPIWNGGPRDGTLLVRGEQGLGEHILFSSMLPELAARVDSVLVEVEPRLVPLFARSFPAVQVMARGSEFPDGIRAQIPMGSLGQYLRPSWQAFPARGEGHLRADPDRVAQLRQRLGAGRKLVGLSWHSRNPKFEAAKSAALRDFAPLLQLHGCRFIDLQYGDTSADRAEVQRMLGVAVEHLDDIDNTSDLDGLAALISACDLVVSVSNTTAHLAGALGRETFVLVPAMRGRMWFWFKNREDSPWYPRLRLRRQRRDQSWTDVVASVAAELAGRQ
jgi:tetratricopeptide (TPR) repeat protein